MLRSALRGSRGGCGAGARADHQVYDGPRIGPHHQSAAGEGPDPWRRALQGVGQALHEDLLYDPRNGQPLTAGYYGARHLTHVDVPEIEVTFIESDDGFGPYGAKTVGEAGIVLAPVAVANAIYNTIGHRMKDLPITRERILGALA